MEKLISCLQVQNDKKKTFETSLKKKKILNIYAFGLIDRDNNKL